MKLLLSLLAERPSLHLLFALLYEKLLHSDRASHASAHACASTMSARAAIRSALGTTKPLIGPWNLKPKQLTADDVVVLVEVDDEVRVDVDEDVDVDVDVDDDDEVDVDVEDEVVVVEVGAHLFCRT